MINRPTRWTNASVIQFAGGNDPIEKMETVAREVALAAMDRGWVGPPFDPIALAEILGYQIEAREDVREARVLYDANLGFKIQFNPIRPKGRTAFSVAHEIAHTLFPDCKRKVRNRSMHSEVADDDWQIEILCNIGAAELLMPTGSFSPPASEDLSLDKLLDERRKFQVSTEAILIRCVKLAKSACAAFSASRVKGNETSGSGKGHYRLDYIIPSQTWPSKTSFDERLPSSANLNECSAIGFTAKGTIELGTRSIAVEAVGLPPYPGRIEPRVAGLLFFDTDRGRQRGVPKIQYVKGDALKPRGGSPKVIAHVINDATTHWGGVSFAAALKKKWPDAHRAFTQKVLMSNREALTLGSVSHALAEPGLHVYNIVAQHGFGKSTTPRIRYAALEVGLKKLAEFAASQGASVHMPRIGAGNAGGSWSVIEELIEDALIKQGVSVMVYDLPR